MLFDIVITSIEKDKFILQHNLNSIKKYVKNYRRIIVVSNNKLTDIEGVEWFDEKKYPFQLRDVYDNLFNYGKNRNRKCSYINQLLKLYAHKIIPDLTENILICDSDIIFIKETTFIKDDKPLYGNRIVKRRSYQPYFEHFLLLNDNFDFLNSKDNIKLAKNNKLVSGICHHIVYNKFIINELIDLIEKTNNTIFWKFYLNKAMEGKKEPANCELYYNYVNKFHNDKIIIREINWLERPADGGSSNSVINNFKIQFNKDKNYALNKGCSYIAYHSYDRSLIEESC